MAQDQPVEPGRLDAEQRDVAVEDLGRIAGIQHVLRTRPAGARFEMQRKPPFAGQGGHRPARDAAPHARSRHGRARPAAGTVHSANRPPPGPRDGPPTGALNGICSTVLIRALRWPGRLRRPPGRAPGLVPSTLFSLRLKRRWTTVSRSVAGHPDEARAVGELDRVDVARVEDPDHPGVEPVALRRLDDRLVPARRFSGLPPHRHFGVLDRLAVDGPGRAVVVRRRFDAVLVYMGEHHEPEFGVLVEPVDAALGIGPAMGGDETRRCPAAVPDWCARFRARHPRHRRRAPSACARKTHRVCKPSSDLLRIRLCPVPDARPALLHRRVPVSAALDQVVRRRFSRDSRRARESRRLHATGCNAGAADRCRNRCRWG